MNKKRKKKERINILTISKNVYLQICACTQPTNDVFWGNLNMQIFISGIRFDF